MLLTFTLTINVPHYPGGTDGELDVIIEAEAVRTNGAVEVTICDSYAETEHGPWAVTLSDKAEDRAVQKAVDLYHARQD